MDVARVVCSEGKIDIVDPIVRARGDGVHVLIRNEGSTSMEIYFHSVRGFGAASADPGASEEQSIQIQPGTSEVQCSFPEWKDDGGTVGAPLTVVDDAGLWRDGVLECDRGVGGTVISDGDPVGPKGDPYDIAPGLIHGLRPDDTLESAGYPEARPPYVRVVRDGNVVGVYQLGPDGRGGWWIGIYDHCEGAPRA